MGSAMKLAGPIMSMTPMGKMAGLAGGAMGALGALGGGGGDAGGGGGGGMMGAAGAPGGSGGPGGGSGPITINNPPVRINVQVSGSDMAASSGVFEEDIGGVPGMTDNTVAAHEPEPEPEPEPGGGLGSLFGRGKDKKDKKERPPIQVKGGKGGRGRGRYTEEFSGGGIIPQLEESDYPLLVFALVAILVSLTS